MPLDFQTITAPFRLGVDEGTDPKQEPPGTLMTCKDLVWIKTGRLQKRLGINSLTTAIVGGGNVGAAARLFTRGSELCLIDGTKIYSYTAAGWVLAANLGKVAEVGLTWQTAQDSYDGVRSSDAALTSDGRLIQAWVTGDPAFLSGGNIFYRITDQASGVQTTKTIQVTGTVNQPQAIRVLASGTNWILVFNDNASGNISCVVNGAAPATLRADAFGGGAAFDACIIGTYFVLAYHLAANGISLRRYSIASTPVEQTNGVVTGEAASDVEAISIDGNVNDTLWIGYARNQPAKGFRIARADPTSLAQTLAPADIETGMAGLTEAVVGVTRIDATSCLYAYSANGSALGGYTNGMTASVVVPLAGSPLNVIRRTAGVRLLTRPFYLGSVAYAFVASWLTAYALGSGIYPPGGDSYLIEITTAFSNDGLPHRYVGHIDVLTAGNWGGRACANAAAISATSVTCFLPTLASAPPGQLSFQQGTRAVTATIGASLPADMWRPVTLDRETYLSAGVLQAYDGRQAFDAGFAGSAYVDMSATAASAAGGGMATGNYLYTVVPEYRSSAGVLHRGPPGPAQTVSVTSAGSTGSVALKIIPVQLSQKQPDRGAVSVAEPIHVMLALFRSIAGQPIPQRLTVEPTYNVLLQSASGSPQAFTDTRNDAGIPSPVVLSTRPAVYTQGGELPDYQAPAFTTITLYRNRIFGIAGDERTIWFSKSYTSNPGTMPGFSPNFRILFSERITGLAVCDERLFVFFERGIAYFAGDGPNPNGNNSDYGEPNRLQSDVGCKTPRGTVSTPLGIMFVGGGANTVGIYLLNRKLSLDWIGQRVQGLLLSYPNVTSAVLVADKNHVRWTCNNAGSAAGIVLVYDYVQDQWSHFTYAGGVPIADALLHQGVYTVVTTAGVVYKETEAAWLDNGAYVSEFFETAWIYRDGPLNYQSVRNFLLEGISNSAHGLTVSVGFNGNPAYTQVITFPEGIANVTAPGPIEDLKVSIGTARKCQCIRFKVQSTAPQVLGTGQGPMWSTMGIEVGAKRGPPKLAIAAQK